MQTPRYDSQTSYVSQLVIHAMQGNRANIVFSPCASAKHFIQSLQALDNVDVCHFDFHNESHWKAMSADALRSVCGSAAVPGWPSLPPLCASAVDTTLLSNNLEYELRALVMQHRRVRGISQPLAEPLKLTVPDSVRKSLVVHNDFLGVC